MFNVVTKKAGKQTLVVFEGELVIEFIDEMKEALRDAIINSEQVRIEFGNVDVADFSFLQLICSAHRSVELKNKILVLSRPMPEALKKAADRMGFTRYTTCPHGKINHCLWRPEERISYSSAS